MSQRDEILQQALALSPQDRAYMATALEDSLPAIDVGPVVVESDVPAEFQAEQLLSELERRSSAYRNGRTTAHDAADVLADLRQRQSNEVLP